MEYKKLKTYRIEDNNILAKVIKVTIEENMRKCLKK